MTSWYCKYQTPPGQAYYYNGFESSSQGLELGERVFRSEPYCGRFSLKNPQYIFSGGQTRDMWGRVLEGYDVARYQQVRVCSQLQSLKAEAYHLHCVICFC